MKKTIKSELKSSISKDTHFFINFIQLLLVDPDFTVFLTFISNHAMGNFLC